MKKWLRGFLCLLLTSGSAQAEAPKATTEDRRNSRIESALSALYHLEFEQSKSIFNDLARTEPEHPIGLYGKTTALWWELTNEYDEKNPALEQEFLASAEATVALTRRWIKKGDPSGVGNLCLGGALGLVARWDAIQGHWVAAYRNGKKAFDLQSKAIKLNPDLYDAYLGPGIFHYYVAVLPAGVKLLARMVFGGSKEQGLREIGLAMTRGQFSRTAARLFLVNIYTNNEKDPAAALALLREGRREYPDSPFFHLVELLILEEAKNWGMLESESREFLKRIDEGKPHYKATLKHRGLFSLANSFLGRRNTAEALELYNRILAEFPLEDRWITLTYLNRGKTYDLLGRREDALVDYRAVLKRRDVWELHDKAKMLIKRPFKE